MVNAKPAGLPLKATKVMRPHLRDGGEEDPDRLAGEEDPDQTWRVGILSGAATSPSCHCRQMCGWRITVSEGWLAGEAWPPTVS